MYRLPELDEVGHLRDAHQLHIVHMSVGLPIKVAGVGHARVAYSYRIWWMLLTAFLNLKVELCWWQAVLAELSLRMLTAGALFHQEGLEGLMLDPSYEVIFHTVDTHHIGGMVAEPRQVLLLRSIPCLYNRFRAI